MPPIQYSRLESGFARRNWRNDMSFVGVTHASYGLELTCLSILSASGKDRSPFKYGPIPNSKRGSKNPIQPK